MDKKTKNIIISLLVLIILLIVGIIWISYDRYKEITEENLQPRFEDDGWEKFLFKTDKENNIIIFWEFSYNGSEDLIWENMEITNGTAMLPSGIIEEGDEITNCSGYVCLTWKPSNKTLTCLDFR